MRIWKSLRAYGTPDTSKANKRAKVATKVASKKKTV
jgi:hypothetical protein